MTYQTKILQADTITLPKSVSKAWRGKKVYIQFSEDTILVKKVREAPFWQTLERLRTVGKRVSKKDISAAIRSARQ